MTSDNYYFFFALFVASGLFLWLLGTASFDRRLEAGSIYRAPWLGYALLVCVLQLSHLVLPINNSVSITVVVGLALLGTLFASRRQGLDRVDRDASDVDVGLGRLYCWQSLSLLLFRCLTVARSRCVTSIWGSTT